MRAVLKGNLCAGNRLDVQAPGHLGKVQGAAQVVMVGEGQGGIAQFSGPYQKLLYRGSSFLKGIITMAMQFGVGHIPGLGILSVPGPIQHVPKDRNLSAVFSAHPVIHPDHRPLPPPLFINVTKVVY
jgi:hypothetical protein